MITYLLDYQKDKSSVVLSAVMTDLELQMFSHQHRLDD